VKDGLENDSKGGGPVGCVELFVASHCHSPLETQVDVISKEFAHRVVGVDGEYHWSGMWSQTLLLES
jgi:hypothetical protein